MTGTSTTYAQEKLYRAYRDDFLRFQPCAACGKSDPEPAHVQGISGKRVPGQDTVTLQRCRQGVSLLYALPLCSACHRTAPDSFHSIGQAAFSVSRWGSEKAILEITNRYVMTFLVAQATKGEQ